MKDLVQTNTSFRLGRLVFEMGGYAGHLPRKFISFHSLESDSNEKEARSTEGVENIHHSP